MCPAADRQPHMVIEDLARHPPGWVGGRCIGRRSGYSRLAPRVSRGARLINIMAGIAFVQHLAFAQCATQRLTATTAGGSDSKEEIPAPAESS
jgi:hypothetical protein